MLGNPDHALPPVPFLSLILLFTNSPRLFVCLIWVLAWPRKRRGPIYTPALFLVYWVHMVFPQSHTKFPREMCFVSTVGQLFDDHYLCPSVPNDFSSRPGTGLKSHCRPLLQQQHNYSSSGLQTPDWTSMSCWSTHRRVFTKTWSRAIFPSINHVRVMTWWSKTTPLAHLNVSGGWRVTVIFEVNRAGHSKTAWFCMSWPLMCRDCVDISISVLIKEYDHLANLVVLPAPESSCILRIRRVHFWGFFHHSEIDCDCERDRIMLKNSIMTGFVWYKATTKWCNAHSKPMVITQGW